MGLVDVEAKVEVGRAMVVEVVVEAVVVVVVKIKISVEDVVALVEVDPLLSATVDDVSNGDVDDGVCANTCAAAMPTRSPGSQ